jgi:hypothetical protein
VPNIDRLEALLTAVGRHDMDVLSPGGRQRLAVMKTLD